MDPTTGEAELIAEPNVGGLFWPLMMKVLATEFISFTVLPPTRSNVKVAIIVK